VDFCLKFLIKIPACFITDDYSYFVTIGFENN